MPKPLRFLLPMVLFAILLAVCIFVVPVGNSIGRVSETKTTVVFVHQPAGTVDLHWNPGDGATYGDHSSE